MRACWRLGGTDGLQHLRLRDWTHMLGFRGHFTTKSPAYSTTFTALRRARHQHARHDHARQERARRDDAREEARMTMTAEARARRQPRRAEPRGRRRRPGRPLRRPRRRQEETTLVINHWRYAGRGYTHPSDAIAAAYFAETRRQSRQAAREAAALAT